eukprot:g79034.t1
MKRDTERTKDTKKGIHWRKNKTKFYSNFISTLSPFSLLLFAIPSFRHRGLSDLLSPFSSLQYQVPHLQLKTKKVAKGKDRQKRAKCTRNLTGEKGIQAAGSGNMMRTGGKNKTGKNCPSISILLILFPFDSVCRLNNPLYAHEYPTLFLVLRENLNGRFRHRGLSDLLSPFSSLQYQVPHLQLKTKKVAKGKDRQKRAKCTRNLTGEKGIQAAGSGNMMRTGGKNKTPLFRYS